MITKMLIIFLIRKRLGLKKREYFNFSNQKNKDDFYYFTDTHLIKVNVVRGVFRNAHVSLNWLLNDSCEIEKK